MQEKTTNNWVKIGLIVLTIMMFVSLFRVEAGEDFAIEESRCRMDSLAVENLEYLQKGIEIWNGSTNRQDELLEALNMLALGLDFDNGCLFVKSTEEVGLIISDLEDAGLKKEEMLNAQVKRLNKSGYIEPLSGIVVVEK